MNDIRYNYRPLKGIHFCKQHKSVSNLIDGASLFEKLWNTDKNAEVHHIALRFACYYLQNIESEFSNFFTDYKHINTALMSTLDCTEFCLPESVKLASVTLDLQGGNPPICKFSQYVYRSYASQALTMGSWLRNISSPATNHLDYVSPLHELHYHIVGSDKTGISLQQRIERLFAEQGIDLAQLLTGLREGGPEVSSLLTTNIYLAIGLFSRVFTPEILGITLFETCTTNIGLKFSSADTHLLENSSSSFVQLEKLLQQYLPQQRTALAISAVVKYLAGLPENQLIEHKQRISKGYSLAYSLRLQYLKKLQAMFNAGLLNPHYEMLALIKNKAKFAVGYHSKIRVNQKPLDSLFMQDAEVVVRHLAKSKYVKPGNPQVSRLCGKSIEFGGPMFRIFDEREQEVIQDWIVSLADESYFVSESCPIKKTSVKHKLLSISELTELGVVDDYQLESESIRSLYYHFLNIEYFPGLLSRANRFAEFWLQRCRYRLQTGECALPFTEYTHEKIGQWFNKLAINQLQSYENRKSETISKDRLKNASLQLCPMIFIDGAWLQKVSEPMISRRKIGTILGKIYSDEVGNGRQEWNHPNLYRKLMRDMSFALPEFDEMAFVEYSSFDNNAFLVPVFWLSVSLFPRRYMEEILGLNLAMELSGVGDSYRVARDQLKSHGFSTLFVDLHNTIDNVSTGHSAMALEAIKIHLDEVGMQGGQASVNEAWKKIWIGYRALVPPRGVSNFIYASIVGKADKHKYISSSNFSEYDGDVSVI